MPACCITGFRWDGSPKGREDHIANSKTYITGDNKERAILIVHDAWGWTSVNNRLLADHFADEIDATVYVPDFFKDDPYPFDEWQRQADAGQIEPDWEAKADAQFEKANGKDVRRAEIFDITKLLKSQYKRLGVAGYCWGGWGAFHLGAKGVDLVDCISVAHPAFLVKDEVDAIGVPVQLNIPEIDEFVTNDFKAFFLQSLPKTGVAWMYQHYPGMEHGFATRGNGKDPAEARAMILAKDITVTWFRNWLAI